MGGAATLDEIAKFRNLRARRWSVPKAAKEIGRSEQWGYQQEAKERNAAEKREITEGGNPKTYAELDGGVKDCLKDFNLFAETFLARRPVPWRLDAANRVVGWLNDKSQDTYAVLNMPPRAGKTTLFTLDIPLWLICGGGIEDPEVGRAVRIMLGHRIEKESKKYVSLLRNIMEFATPFYCKEQKREAELVLAQAFGRFRPKKTLGEFDLWRDNEFVVAQIGDRSIYQKDRTVSAASREGGFLGTRVDLSVWDDLVTSDTCRTLDAAEAINEWWENEAEERIEPGGVNLLVGQRLSNLDLYHARLQKTYEDDRGDIHRLYHHIVYPAHSDKTCANGAVTRDCTQWDARDEGCLLDAERLNPEKLWKAQTKGKFRTVYQQEDSNPEDVLVDPAWIYGGRDAEDFPADGCLDTDRGFYEWPEGVKGLIDFVAVDPSGSNYWAFEWWALEPVEPFRSWLIWGERKKMHAGTDKGFLDYNATQGRLVGVAEDVQNLSGELGHPIRAWVIETNAMAKWLPNTNAFDMWRKKWPMLHVIRHTTGKYNKNESDYSVQATLPHRYKLGLKRLPYKRGTDVRNYISAKINELTHYPDYPTWDTVMADWFGEFNMRQIISHTRILRNINYGKAPDPTQPAYMRGKKVAANG